MSMMLPEGMPAPVAPPEPAGPQDMTGDVRQLIDAVRAFAEANGLSEQERLLVEDITSKLQKLSAEREKEEQGMLAGKMSPGAMQRAYTGG